MTDNFDGEPRMVLTADGVDFDYNDGQPVMDAGLENNAMISLFTTEGWAGNILLQAENKVGSDFEKVSRGTITMSQLSKIQNSAGRALNDSQQKVTQNIVTVGNSNGSKIDVALRLSPTADDVDVLLTSDAGLNWKAQALNPANQKV